MKKKMSKEHKKIIELADKYNRPTGEFGLRLDGRIEWFCEHGVGHTVWFPKGSDGIHGCDGCCKKLKTDRG